MKKYMKFLLLVLAVGLLNSCFKEYLDPEPTTAISDLTAFDTRARILNQVNALYVPFKSGQYLGGRYQVYMDIRGDDFINLQSNGVTGLQTWSHLLATSTGEVNNLWIQVYAGINRINVFLEGLATNQAKIVPAMITAAEFDQFRGEALALRGMAYFHLLQLYARPFNQNPTAWGVVLRLTAQRSAANNDMARSTVAECYTQILTDLNNARPLLPLSHGGVTANNVLNVTRMQRNTVIALLTRVHLHMNNYSGVLTAATGFVPAAAPFLNTGGGVAYSLPATFAAVFLPPYTSSESIFSIPMTAAELPGTQNQLGFYFSVAPTGGLEYRINVLSPNWTNITEFPATDARRLLTRVHTATGNIFIDKYPTGPAHTDYAPVIRYAEVLLNVAEAEARVNGINARALGLLNAVYLRSNSGGTPLVAGNFANADAFVDRVMRERNMEFMGEGIRSMDITRKVAPFPAKGAAVQVLPTSSAYIWPMPEQESNTNKLLQPNN